MRLVTYEIETALGRFERLGALEGDRVVDLNFAYAWLLRREGEPAAYRLADAIVPAAMLAFLEVGDRAMHEARRVLKALHGHGDARGERGEKLWHALADVRLLAPLPHPNSMRDF